MSLKIKASKAFKKNESLLGEKQTNKLVNKQLCKINDLGTLVLRRRDV